MDRKTLVACLSALLVLTSCSGRDAIVVGSKNFTEQIVLGEILAQQIERQLGVPVVRKLDLGGTLLAHEALAGGSIDLYPEYTGTALTAVLKRRAMPDAKAVLDAVHDAYHQQWQLQWMKPFGFINTFAMVVRRDSGQSTLSAAAQAHAWRLGMGYEFRQRPDGLDGLLKAYHLRLEGEPLTMDLGLLYSALQSGKVDMIAANSTDGLLSVLNVTALQDDLRYFPPYQCAVIVREATLAKYAGLSTALEQLSGKIPESVMRNLNYQVDGKHRRVAEVAEEFLRTAVR
jgi:glycine betaine/choline ABC-type transport system substrate-binding protein